ncbi:MAG: pilus assembly protein TadG-related protein [Caulobacteraceae bacterium]
MIFAIVLPVGAVVTAGAIDLASVYGDKAAMQAAADGAALAAAKQLSVANQDVGDRAKAMVASDLAKVADRIRLETTVKVPTDQSQVTVEIAGHRPSFFANLLPPGGFHIYVSATATSVGKMPLCVLATAERGHTMQMRDTAQMTANGCLVQSNSDLTVSNSGLLQAGMVQAVGKAQGRITPAPQTGAPTIPDPFEQMGVATPDGCQPLDLLYSVGVQILAPGVHCGNITVDERASIVLLPGEHYFGKGKLELKKFSSLSGNDVVLVFDKDSDLKFGDNSTIDLQGRKSGPLKGFVIATTRANEHTFEISSDSARRLLGTIYVPAATLLVQGERNQVADQSAWTVIVAETVQLAGGSNLVINHDYAGSSVPVPKGVGPAANVRLTR